MTMLDEWAGDPDQAIPDDAIPFHEAIGADDGPGLLPDWYMPATASATRLTGWRRRIAWLLVAAFLAVVTSGLCNTYGYLELA